MARGSAQVPHAPAEPGVWLGLDVGTQSARALAVTATGEVVGAGTQPLASRRSGARHEQDPEAWWQAIAAASSEAMQTVPAKAVRGVAVDATSGTIVLVDRKGSPLTPGLMYDDARATGFVDRVNEAGAHVWAELGYGRMQPSWALPKLLWLLETCPQLPRGAGLAHQSDFVNRRLVGRAVPSDLSSALKSGAHLIEERWPSDVMDALGVPADLLPELVRSGTVIGAVSRAAAAATAIPVGTPLIAGMTDGCAAQLAAGALRPGCWNSVLGTTLVVKGVTRALIRDPLGAVYSHRAPNGDWLPGGASSTGAGLISRDFAGRDLDELGRAASAHEPAAMLAYPLVSPGERFPFVAPQAQGFELGGDGSEEDRFAAVLQGVGYVERLCYDYLDLLGAPIEGELVLTGGATRSEYWCQLRADILGRPVSLPDNSESALGMAILAASPDRDLADVAAEMVRIRVTIDPRAGSAGRFVGSYVRLVEELEGRGWLGAALAGHARERAQR
ncbi:MAG: FGGY family carbohydrate kinase [Candidatus Limnocylindrales bacterium]|jgi:sugar (pentulose or hexulose) kinase